MHLNLANALVKLQRLQEAVAHCDAGIALQPTLAYAHYLRGKALAQLHRFESALASFNNAIALQPASSEPYSDRAATLRLMQRPEESLASSDAAIAIQPGHAEAHSIRGAALQDLGRFEEALGAYERAMLLDSNLASARTNAAQALLLTGRFSEGWELLEWRMRPGGLQAMPQFTRPQWRGDADLAGRTLFVHSEQGLGDTIQFCRYAALAERAGARVAMSVQPSLRRLLKGMSPSIQLLSQGDIPPDFDYVCPLLSLPFAFRTTLETIPADIPYLSAEPEKVGYWRQRLGSSGYRIGICWQGTVDPRVDIGRSFTAALFQPIASIPGVRLISLQKGAGAEQLRDIEGAMIELQGEALDPGPDAFVDTAAVMANLDLVITSDTSVAHVAGALGCETWVALKQVPDWRWLLARKDSPWYPRHRLFRQQRRGDWAAVFDQMLQELRPRVEARNSIHST
jgi:tetratricopeptide (TPR) repeat protein